MHKTRDVSGIVACKTCLISKQKTRSGSHGLGKTLSYIYKDENGKRWNRRNCPDCSKKETKAISRRLGIHKDRLAAKDHKNRKGIEAELTVGSVFKTMGFDVSISLTRGADLTLTMGGTTITCEVKSITTRLVGKKDYYFCSPVYPNRRNDDLMALYYRGTIILETMKEHLSKCAPCGRRELTSLFRETKR